MTNKKTNKINIPNRNFNIKQQQIIKQTFNFNNKLDLSFIHLPLPKLVVIRLMKIYKILIKNENLFDLQLNLQFVDYLLSMTRYRKGMIEGVRLELIQVIEKGGSVRDEESIREEVSAS